MYPAGTRSFRYGLILQILQINYREALLTSREIIDKAAYLYQTTQRSVKDICQEVGIGYTTFFRNYDGPKRGERNKGRKYSFNIKKLQEDSHDKYYWLGFIAADGAVVDRSLHIELKDTDENHLIKFRDFLESDYPIKKRINNVGCHCAKISINSLDLVDYLKNYNIVQKKSLIFNIPTDKIPQEYIYDFVRGMMDGDGNIQIQGNKQLSLTFCSGNEKCVYQIREIFGVNNKVSFGSGTYHIQIKGNNVAKQVLDKLYASSSEYNRLDRKYNIYKQTLN